MTDYILYNPLSNNRRGKQRAETLRDLLSDGCLAFRDLTKITDLRGFLAGLDASARVILCGGDGTLNRFINALDGKMPRKNLYYFAAGSGNDFLNDLPEAHAGEPILLDPYLEDLPWVEVRGQRYCFLNGVGFGIDGYCCQEGDRLRRKSSRRTNYTAIALKGLAYAYKPVNARICVDGKTREYQRVWLAPSMLGRFYGGGMMIAPGQDRCGKEGDLTLVVVHDCSKLRILTAFPTIMNGTHLRYEGIVDVLTGQDITVTFDRPCALQIDGETFSDVTEYHAMSGKTARGLGKAGREQKDGMKV